METPTSTGHKGKRHRRVPLAPLVQERATDVRERNVEKASVSVPWRTRGHVDVDSVAEEQRTDIGAAIRSAKQAFGKRHRRVPLAPMVQELVDVDGVAEEQRAEKGAALRSTKQAFVIPVLKTENICPHKLEHLCKRP